MRRSLSYAMVALVLLMVSTASMLDAASCNKQALVVMSSAGEIVLHNILGDHWNQTVGFYLDEWYYPTSSLLANGWSLTYANPKTNQPPVDPRSNSSSYFESEQDYQDALAQFAQQTASPVPGTLASPFPLSSIAESDLSVYDLVLIPGGHPPMVDLYLDESLGTILNWFHQNAKPTAAICHGPVALLSAQLVVNDWPYQGYNLTVFPTSCEIAVEALWGGLLPFMPETVLSDAGAVINNFEGVACKDPHVVVTKELITGMNPASAPLFAETLMNYLSDYCSQ
eukprot:TRINITY_DN3781_c0_g1_i1.p1 TRINITY_DN3781_c0_g1~~TRINITY_DN3781_c0_g1_i1.p1  ORF type:complete len:283 (+),score=51.34 TRINITY_DN3781_c0_g1_i1:203-1051(+)